MLREAWNGFTRPERKRCVWFVTTLHPEWKVVPTVAFSHFFPRLPCRLVVWMPGNAGESAYPKTNVKLMGRRGKVGRCEPWHYVRANDPAHGDSSVFCFPLCKWRFFFSSRRWFSLRPVDLKKSPQPENEMRRVVIYLWKWKKSARLLVDKMFGCAEWKVQRVSPRQWYRECFIYLFFLSPPVLLPDSLVTISPVQCFGTTEKEDKGNILFSHIFWCMWI